MSDEAHTKALDLHRSSFVFDALTYFCDGACEAFRDGGVNATNITVPTFEADWPQACQATSSWLERLGAPSSPWTLIESGVDFDRIEACGTLGIVMGWQNMRPVEDSLDRIGFFHKLGVRIMQPTYNHQNMLGNGCLEPKDDGLSGLGRDAVRIMNEHGIAIDLSHVGERTSLDIIDISRQPVLVTHANASAIVPLPRNKSDDVIRAVAETGGVVGPSIYGAMLWDGSSRKPPTVDDYLAHVEHMVELIGWEHVGFGTDFPAVKKPWKIRAERSTPRVWDAIVRYGETFGESVAATYPEGIDSQSDLPAITAAMLRRGWPCEALKGYLGENFRRVLRVIWGG